MFQDHFNYEMVFLEGTGLMEHLILIVKCQIMDTNFHNNLRVMSDVIVTFSLVKIT